MESYERDIRQFSDYLQEVYHVNDARAVVDVMIRSWLAELMDQGLVPKTINRKISSLKSFYKFLMRQEYIHLNPTLKIQGPKQNKRLPSFIEERKMDMLLETETDDDFEGVRNQLILELFYATGIRRAELIGLLISNVNLASQQIKVLGKRNKERIIPVSANLIQQFEVYFKWRDTIVDNGKDAGWVFLTKKGEKMYPKLVYRIVNTYLSTVSTQSKKSPHVLRHTFATHMLNNGADLNAVKELLGHASLSATQIYTHNTIEKLKKIYQQAHPKA
jgi:integrase/recombinase XerC